MDTSRRGLPCWAIAALVAVGGAVLIAVVVTVVIVVQQSVAGQENESEGVAWPGGQKSLSELRPQGGWTDVGDVFRCSAEDYEAMAQSWVPGLQAEPAGSRTVGGLLSTSVVPGGKTTTRANYSTRAVRPVHIFFETFGKTTLTGAYNLMKQLAKTAHVKVTFVGP
ncbi:unnamed protein product, partial [Amoebophrya sp. A120]|eukprot:GSA120T00010226001.1